MFKANFDICYLKFFKALSHSSVAPGPTGLRKSGFIPTQFLVTEITAKIFAVSNSPSCVLLELQFHLLQEKCAKSEKAGKKQRSKVMIAWLKKALIKVLDISS